jgi:anti-sigma factor RsiW
MTDDPERRGEERGTSDDPSATNDSIHLLTAAYALDALDPAERAEFEAHLPECPTCPAEVRELQETAARLGAAEAAAPPPAMRSAVLAQIAAIGGAADSSGGDPGHAHSSHRVVPIRRRRLDATTVLGIAAGVLALVVATLSVLLVQSRHDQQNLSATAAAVASVVSATDAQSASGRIVGGGRGTVVMSASSGKAVFLAQGLSQPPSGHVYELWYIAANGSAVPAGTFSPSSGGQVAQLMPGRPDSAALVGLTVEPGQGSTTPTTKPTFAVALPAPA